jgi:LacI family transcriptional regulator
MQASRYELPDIEMRDEAAEPERPRRRTQPSPAASAQIRRPTMTDVARVAGVSQSSVSLVLNNMTGARITDWTRERVFKAAQQLGYQLPVRRRETPAATERDTIAFVIDEISTSPHPVVSLDGVRDQAWESGLLVASHVTRSNSELEAATISAIRDDPRVLGVIFATIFTREIKQLPDFGPLPVVLLNCHSRNLTLGGSRPSSVVPAEVSGGFAATDFLLRRGHRRIGFINGEAWMEAAHDRLKGYRQALATHDVPFDPALVRHGDWLPVTGSEETRALLALPQPPTAIFCANDLMAIGAIAAIREAGLRVPEDISIMGYDDQELARYAQPPLSTLVLPNYEMGRQAAEMLIGAAMLDRALRPGVMKVEGPIVERASVRKLDA